MANDMNLSSVIAGDEVLGSNTAAKSELGDDMFDFAMFLADTDLNGEFAQLDATYILRACLERDLSGTEDKAHIDEKIWQGLGVLV